MEKPSFPTLFQGMRRAKSPASHSFLHLLLERVLVQENIVLMEDEMQMGRKWLLPGMREHGVSR